MTPNWWDQADMPEGSNAIRSNAILIVRRSVTESHEVQK